MGDWFDQNAPTAQAPAAPAGDWFATNAPAAAPAAKADAPNDAVTATFADHLKDYWHMVNPKEQAQGLATLATTDPRKTIKSYGEQNQAMFDKAVASFKKGDYLEAARHGLHYLANGVPGLGSGLEDAADDLQAGRIGDGLTKTAAIATNVVVGPKLLGKGTQLATEPNILARGAAKLKAAAPDASTVSNALTKVEKAVTLSPAVSDAIETIPGGSSILGGSKTIARGARVAKRVVNRLSGSEPTVSRPMPQPGVQDPAAVEPKTPIFDTSTELTPEQEAAIASRQSAGPSDWFEANAPKAAPYPGQTDPAAVQPLTPVIDEAVAATPQRPSVQNTAQPAAQVVENPSADVQPTAQPAGIDAAAAPPSPAELLDEIAIGMAGKPFERLSAGEQTGVLRVAGRLATKMNPPAGEPVASAPAPPAAPDPAAVMRQHIEDMGPGEWDKLKTEVQPVDNSGIPAGQPVPDVPAPAAAAPAQRPLLDEPAYDRPVEPMAPEQVKAHHIQAARTVKGRAMARVLSNPPAGPAITAEEARTIPLGDPRWKTISKLAGVNEPKSQESLDAVFKHMDEIEGGRAQLDLGASTSAPGAPAPAAATLPADGTEEASAGRPGNGSGAGQGENVPAAAASEPGAQPGRGATTRVRVPGETTAYPAQYRVRELSELQPSHNGQTFQPNPKYRYKNDRDYSKRENQVKVVEGATPAKFDPAYHITDNPDLTNGPPMTDVDGNALGGNGRVQILQRVYASNPEGAAAYRQMLTDKAQQFGLDPDQIAGMKEPVLVREVADEHLARPQDAITDVNKTGTAALTPAERAIADSRRVSPATLDDMAQRLEKAGPDGSLAKLLAGNDGAEVLQKLIDDGVITSQERAAYSADGKLTKEGQQRITKLMLGRFFRDPAQLDTIPPAVKTKLERLAGPLAKLEGAGEWDLMPTVKEALDLLDEAHAHGTRNLPEFIKQSGLFGEQRYNPDAVTMAKQLQRISAGRLLEQLKEYSRGAGYAAEHAHAKAGLFADDVQGEPPNPRQSFEDAFGYSAKAPSVSTPATSSPKPKAAAPKAKGTAGKIGDQFTKD